MSEKGLTNISLKKINKSKVYQYIYRKKMSTAGGRKVLASRRAKGRKKLSA